MKYKEILKKILFPPLIIMVLLLVFSIIFLIYSFANLESNSIIAIISYVLSAYTLTIWCFKIPNIINFIKKIRKENKYVVEWLSNPRLRINTSLSFSSIFNIIYAIFNLCIGLFHDSIWFISVAIYFALLSIIRVYLLSYARKNLPGENMQKELLKSKICGIILLFMNISLTVMTFLMVSNYKVFIHHQITTIAMAVYTFTSFTIAIVNIVRYKKYNSPIYSSSKAINLVSASVSMLTLEATMLTVFSKESTSIIEKKVLLSITGAIIAIFITSLAIYMIVTKKRVNIKNNKENIL